MPSSDQDTELRSVLEDSTSTGARAVGLRLANYGVGFIASILIARALGPRGRGLYAYPVALLGLVMALSHVGLENANVYLASRGERLPKLWANATLAGAVAGLLTWVALAVAWIASRDALTGGLPTTWLIVPMAQIPFLLQSLYWANILQLDGRLTVATRATLAGVAVHAALAGVLFLGHDLTPFRVLVLACSANGTTWLLLLLASMKAGFWGEAPDWRLLRSGLAFGLKVYLGGAFFFLLLRIDQVLVRHLVGFEALGLYSLATMLAELLWLLTDPLAMSLLPYQVKASSGDDRRLGYATARLCLLISFIAAAVAWIAAPHAIQLVYGAEFQGSVWPFRLLLPGVVALAAIRPLTAILLKEGRPWLVSGFAMLALCLNVILNLALLPAVGLSGASLASSACYVLLAVAYVTATRKRRVAGWEDLVPRRGDLDLLFSGVRASKRRRPNGRTSARSLRVLLVIGSLRRGGTEGQVASLARGLRARGCHVVVLCLSQLGEQADDLMNFDVPVELGRFLKSGPGILVLPLRMLSVFGFIRKHHPDVVQCFLYWGNLMGVPAARAAGVPVVVSSRRSLSKVRGGRRELRPWEVATNRLCASIVCNSQAVLEDAVRAEGLPPEKALVIRNGVEIPDYVPPPRSQPPRILVIANLIAYKGHEVLLHAFSRVVRDMGPDAARLQLAGKGREETHLRALTEELGLVGAVDFLGSVPDMNDRLRECLFTVLPSLTEGMPNAVLESMAAGRAVVASAVGGVPELLGEGGGLMVPLGEPERLATAIEELLADPARTAAMGLDGRRVAGSQFGMDRMVDTTLHLYRRLLEARGKTPRPEPTAEEVADTTFGVMPG